MGYTFLFIIYDKLMTYEVVPSALHNVLMLIICGLFHYAKLLLRDTHIHYKYIERIILVFLFIEL